MGEIKASFDWDNPDVNETVLLPPLHYFSHFVTFVELKQPMSIKKQIQSLGKLLTIYEEIPESFLDETEIDSYFYHKILDIALIDNRIVGVSKGSNKKIFAFKLFQFCKIKNQQRFILGEEVSDSL